MFNERVTSGWQVNGLCDVSQIPPTKNIRNAIKHLTVMIPTPLALHLRTNFREAQTHILKGISRAWSIDIQVIKREVNSDADHMTKLTLGSDISGLVTDSPSTFLVPILDRHIHDLPYARKARSIPGQAVDIHVTS
ncbi:hypothetical protein V6N12_041456 [Hibiscus sabdariffa]|uniref:RNase H type-1 domain-containing protein n=1 Tax=Hibiscus sabdariffa TaxID=183260 RepID=A0ABR2AHA5_9ROSI